MRLAVANQREFSGRLQVVVPFHVLMSEFGYRFKLNPLLMASALSPTNYKGFLFRLCKSARCVCGVDDPTTITIKATTK